MEPLTQLFRSTIENFPSLLLEHRVKLADITSEKEVLGLTDDEILQSEDVFPRRYELETLRYWRKMGLLPFFDQSKHAYISISQMMWLRFLSELKNLGASIAMLKEANYYFIERGYRDEIARLNLLELKKKIIAELEKITSKTEYIKGKRRGRTLFQNFISLNMSVFETLMFKSLVYDINAQPTLFRRHFLVHLTDMPDDFSIDLYSYVMAKRFNLNIFHSLKLRPRSPKILKLTKSTFISLLMVLLFFYIYRTWSIEDITVNMGNN
jgi:DNA-binding transcriptional MerR regulator